MMVSSSMTVVDEELVLDAVVVVRVVVLVAVGVVLVLVAVRDVRVDIDVEVDVVSVADVDVTEVNDIVLERVLVDTDVMVLIDVDEAVVVVTVDRVDVHDVHLPVTTNYRKENTAIGTAIVSCSAVKQKSIEMKV